MIKVTAQQRANLLDALNVMWPSVPKKNVYPNLDNWRVDRETTPPTCGTVACFGGWCAWWPAFKKQGVRVTDGGAPRLMGDGQSFDKPSRVSQRLFGDDGLFACRDYGHDADPDEMARISPHALVTRRLKWLLANSEVV